MFILFLTHFKLIVRYLLDEYVKLQVFYTHPKNKFIILQFYVSFFNEAKYKFYVQKIRHNLH